MPPSSVVTHRGRTTRNPASQAYALRRAGRAGGVKLARGVGHAAVNTGEGRGSFDGNHNNRMEKVVTVARAIACPTRLRILRLLGERGLSVSEAARLSNVSVSTVAFHLAVLSKRASSRRAREGARPSTSGAGPGGRSPAWCRQHHRHRRCPRESCREPRSHRRAYRPSLPPHCVLGTVRVEYSDTGNIDAIAVKRLLK